MKIISVFILAVLVFLFAGLISCSSDANAPSTTIIGIESKIFYAQNTDGSPGYTIIFSLSNYTLYPITANRVQVTDGKGNIKRNIDQAALQKTSSGGIIETGKSLSLSHKTSDLPLDIKDWTVTWQYTDSTGQVSTIAGNYLDRK